MMAKFDLNRRKVLKTAGLVSVSLPFIYLSGCGSDGRSSVDLSDNTDTDSNTDTDNSTDNSTDYTGDWAQGGTANMTANFPDDELFALASSCTINLTKSQTEGPCYFQADVLDDISEEQTGLPMQLCLRLVDSDCQPLSGYEIEVWHCDVNGLYSGDTSDSADSSRFAGGFCTDNDSKAVAAKWFRGTQVTDANGRVNFKTCFPGWYSGRTIHVHFRVKNNNNDQVISQFCFADSFTKEICTTHPDYAARGEQDTPVEGGRDNVFGSNYQAFLFDYSQNEDGSLLAYKTIQIA
ncbi:intradiol ring-cleavage dioxygenase [Catenovulum sp. 2E275]|uniref:dioxygenase family protein n=1 Tax=Catenovulum sp. 2E275 TaxID=2980497 RepID=UPI0021D0FD06|nr:intradiol ring-cleavage dioxygenase [Catenovulum sp. 2E275]MCU4677105.1 intradiol ring-cleavage dioxygenase [Catenovulum sp. 2E275]